MITWTTTTTLQVHNAFSYTSLPLLHARLRRETSSFYVYVEREHLTKTSLLFFFFLNSYTVSFWIHSTSENCDEIGPFELRFLQSSPRRGCLSCHTEEEKKPDRLLCTTAPSPQTIFGKPGGLGVDVHRLPQCSLSLHVSPIKHDVSQNSEKSINILTTICSLESYEYMKIMCELRGEELDERWSWQL